LIDFFSAFFEGIGFGAGFYFFEFVFGRVKKIRRKKL
jgi:hypothetical protein